MKKWIKNGKLFDGTSIVFNGKRIFNPTEEQLIAAGWTEYVYTETLDDVKYQKIAEITDYDNSDNVNIFFINNTPVWIDKATRAGLMLRIGAEQAAGKSETTLWYKDNKFTLPVNEAVNMLYAIELYASECYDNTEQHKYNVEHLNTIEEVKAYDITTGYPEKLYF